jgi:hypothetical protein
VEGGRAPDVEIAGADAECCGVGEGDAIAGDGTGEGVLTGDEGGSGADLPPSTESARAIRTADNGGAKAGAGAETDGAAGDEGAEAELVALPGNWAKKRAIDEPALSRAG